MYDSDKRGAAWTTDQIESRTPCDWLLSHVLSSLSTLNGSLSADSTDVDSLDLDQRMYNVQVRCWGVGLRREDEREGERTWW